MVSALWPCRGEPTFMKDPIWILVDQPSLPNGVKFHNKVSLDRSNQVRSRCWQGIPAEADEGQTQLLMAVACYGWQKQTSFIQNYLRPTCCLGWTILFGSVWFSGGYDISCLEQWEYSDLWRGQSHARFWNVANIHMETKVLPQQLDRCWIIKSLNHLSNRLFAH